MNTTLGDVPFPAGSEGLCFPFYGEFSKADVKDCVKALSLMDPSETKQTYSVDRGRGDYQIPLYRQSGSLHSAGTLGKTMLTNYRQMLDSSRDGRSISSSDYRHRPCRDKGYRNDHLRAMYPGQTSQRENGRILDRRYNAFEDLRSRAGFCFQQTVP